jgi:uncharacterized protein
MPGPTETNFFHRAGMDDTRVGRPEKDDPADVTRQGFDALMAVKDGQGAASVMTKAQELANKVTPDKLGVGIHGMTAEPES